MKKEQKLLLVALRHNNKNRKGDVIYEKAQPN